MDGARTFDTLGDAGRQAGTFTGDPADGTTLLKLLIERCEDPKTRMRPCRHLAATPLQPQYIHAAVPTRVSCKTCYAIFGRTHAKAVTRYAASTDCDVCEAEMRVFHLCLVSNGPVTFTVNKQAKTEAELPTPSRDRIADPQKL